MERSKAIKSPSINFHLAGTKKVQQELAKPGVLERFIKDAGEVKMIREIFTGLYPVDKVICTYVLFKSYLLWYNYQ